MGYMIKDYHCCCCGKKIAFDEHDFIIKRKFIFPDHDGIWTNYGKEHLCGNCMNKLRKMIAEEQNLND